MLYGLRPRRWDELVAAGTTCASTCPTARTGSPTSTAACASARRTCFRAQQPVPAERCSPSSTAARTTCASRRCRVPEPGPGEMLVRVDACGVCPTDLKKIQKGLLPGPRIFGHEIAGTVAALGAGDALPRGRARGRAPPRPLRRLLLLRAQAYAQCAVYKQNGTTAGFEPSGGGFAEYVRAMDWIVERGTIAIPDGVLRRGGGLRRAGQHLPEGRAEGRRREGRDRAGRGPGADRPAADAARALGGGGGARLGHASPSGWRLGRSLGRAPWRSTRAGDVAREVRAPDGGPRRRLRAGRGRRAGGLRARPCDATRPGGRVMSSPRRRRARRPWWTWGAAARRREGHPDRPTARRSTSRSWRPSSSSSREVRVRELVTHRLPLARGLEAFELAAQPGAGRAQGGAATEQPA